MQYFMQLSKTFLSVTKKKGNLFYDVFLFDSGLRILSVDNYFSVFPNIILKSVETGCIAVIILYLIKTKTQESNSASIIDQIRFLNITVCTNNVKVNVRIPLR